MTAAAATAVAVFLLVDALKDHKLLPKLLTQSRREWLPFVCGVIAAIACKSFLTSIL